MKKITKIISLILVLIVFASFAVGSSSKEAKESSGDETTAAGESTDESTTAAKSGEALYELGEGIVKIWSDSLDSNWIMVAVPVKNTGGTNLFISSCTIDVENEKGELEQTINSVSAMPQVIKPNETAYYFEETTYDGKSKENLKLIPHVQIEEATVDCVRYDVSEIKVKDNEYSGASVTGRVENKTSEAGTSVYIVANLFDKDGKFLCQEFTILDNDLPAGDKVGFETSPYSFDFKAKDVGKYEVYAYPDQYQF